MSSKPVKLIYKIKTHKKNFVTVDTEILDGRMSPTAVWLLVYCLSKPETWNINVAAVVRATGIKRHTVDKAMHELEALGYSKLIGSKDRTNGRITYKRLMRESPAMVLRCFEEACDPRFDHRSRSTVNGITVNGDTVNGETRTIVKKELVKKEVVKKESDDNDVAAVTDPPDTYTTNQFPGHCARCNYLVEVGDGILVGKTPAHRTDIECAEAATKKRDWMRTAERTSSTYVESDVDDWAQYSR